MHIPPIPILVPEQGWLGGLQGGGRGRGGGRLSDFPHLYCNAVYSTSYLFSSCILLSFADSDPDLEAKFKGTVSQDDG
jgi:hypothetical protein